MDLITVSAAPSWWLLTRLDDGRWRRDPLVGWGMVSEPASVAFVVGLVVATDGESVELAPVGRYVNESQLPSCECKAPATEVCDVGFCTRCGSVLR